MDVGCITSVKVSIIEGRINNFIDVTDFKAYTGDTEFENERHAVHCSRAVAEASKVKNAAAIAHQAKSSSSSSSEQSLLNWNSMAYQCWCYIQL